jgi:hypothetical protein
MINEPDELLYGKQPEIQLPREAAPSNVDTDNFDTLRAVRDELTTALAELDGWHAFDLAERDGLTIKQQIKAHQLAYAMMAPLLDSINSALDQVNRKYRNQ